MTVMLEGYFKNDISVFADVILNNNEHVTVYCPNTGRLTTCLEENAPVLLSKAQIRTENSSSHLNIFIQITPGFVLTHKKPTPSLKSTKN